MPTVGSRPLIRAIAAGAAIFIEQLVSNLLSGLYEWIKKRRAARRHKLNS